MSKKTNRQTLLRGLAKSLGTTMAALHSPSSQATKHFASQLAKSQQSLLNAQLEDGDFLDDATCQDLIASGSITIAKRVIGRRKELAEDGHFEIPRGRTYLYAGLRTLPNLTLLQRQWAQLIAASGPKHIGWLWDNGVAKDHSSLALLGRICRGGDTEAWEKLLCSDPVPDRFSSQLLRPECRGLITNKNAARAAAWYLEEVYKANHHAFESAAENALRGGDLFAFFVAHLAGAKAERMLEYRNIGKDPSPIRKELKSRFTTGHGRMEIHHIAPNLATLLCCPERFLEWEKGFMDGIEYAKWEQRFAS